VSMRDDWATTELMIECMVCAFAAICWTVTKRSDAENDKEERRRDLMLYILAASIVFLLLVIIVNYVNTAYFRGVRLIIDTCVYALKPFCVFSELFLTRESHSVSRFVCNPFSYLLWNYSVADSH
jgi:small-conductance mechanosensitive channel